MKNKKYHTVETIPKSNRRKRQNHFIGLVIMICVGFYIQKSTF